MPCMAVLQALKPTSTTFGIIAEQMFKTITYGTSAGGGVDFVCDRYPQTSIKSEKRACSGALVVTITDADQKLPTWKKYSYVKQ